LVPAVTVTGMFRTTIRRQETHKIAVTGRVHMDVGLHPVIGQNEPQPVID